MQLRKDATQQFASDGHRKRISSNRLLQQRDQRGSFGVVEFDSRHLQRNHFQTEAVFPPSTVIQVGVSVPPPPRGNGTDVGSTIRAGRARSNGWQGRQLGNFQSLQSGRITGPMTDCRAVPGPRATYHYRSRRPEQEPLRKRIREIPETRIELRLPTGSRAAASRRLAR